MRISLSWLRELVPVEAEPDELAERLSLSGLAVEEVIHVGRGIEGVVVGEVRSMREHPDADNLMLVKAFDGSAERDVVCGARNYAPGDLVPLAVPGATLPGGLEIARRTIRGETSDGMLCSMRELGIAEDHSGIWVLPREKADGKDLVTAVGDDLVQALGLRDTVFHLDVTTNRGDCLSVLGVAREVAALYDLRLTLPDAGVPESGREAAEHATVTIEDERGCPRYLARVIEGIGIGPSPWWMQQRLLTAGMRPISNVVDVTNYVLLERGHPLHAFDLDRLAGNAIVVRRPAKGESITTLDGVERALRREDVLICDAARPVAVAGIMGGAESEVTPGTTRVLLESAYFDPLRVRRTAARLGLRTEASVRFERGADPEGVSAAAARAARLLAEVAGGVVARGAIDVYPKPVARKPVRLRAKRANALLGLELETAEIAGILERLGCSVEASASAVRATPPAWRPDLAIEEDLIEEVARIHGYEAIPEALPGGSRVGGLTPEQRGHASARQILLGAGLNEAQTQSLLSPAFPDRAGLGPDHPLRAAWKVANPVSEEESVLRSSLLPGLLLAAQRNASRRVLPIALFETGVVFGAGGDAPVERRGVAFVLCGPAPEGWHAPGRPLDFFDARGVVEALLDGLGVPEWTLQAPEVGAPEDGDSIGMLHPGRRAVARSAGRELGAVGELHPDVAEALELPARVAVASLDLDLLVTETREADIRVPARTPPVTRDVAVVVGEAVPAAAVEGTIREAAGPLLEAIELFDVYRGEPVPAGSVSLAYALALRDPERTLTDEEADKVMTEIADAAKAAGWQIRD